jgi:hypothetical protein
VKMSKLLLRDGDVLRQQAHMAVGLGLLAVEAGSCPGVDVAVKALPNKSRRNHTPGGELDLQYGERLRQYWFILNTLRLTYVQGLYNTVRVLGGGRWVRLDSSDPKYVCTVLIGFVSYDNSFTGTHAPAFHCLYLTLFCISQSLIDTKHSTANISKIFFKLAQILKIFDYSLFFPKASSISDRCR